MKTFPNLAGILRFYFGLARALALVFATLWLIGLLLGPSFQRFFGDEPKLMVSVGEASLKTESGAVELRSDRAKAGSLLLSDLKGSLQMDLMSKDPALVSVLRWALIPSIVVLAVFSWLLFTSLLRVCANIERREAFTEGNLRQVRNIGMILLAYNLTGLVAQFWSAHVMDGYLTHHVTLSGIKTALQFPSGLGALHYNLTGGHFPAEGGFITGLVVLLVAEAFRQGLALKTENDLTV
jgi:hypothetical protein